MKKMNQLIPHSQPWISKKDLGEVEKNLKSKMIGNGRIVEKFEKNISNFLSAKYCFTLCNGTNALLVSLITLNIKSSDEVILPSYVCKDVLDAVLFSGAKPKICDVNKNGVVTYETIKKFFTKKTKAIIAVHIFGNICDIKSLKKFKVPIIEDACQAFGVDINGKKAGTLGDIGILSFNATKCLTTGEGGMILTNKSIFAKKIQNILHNKDIIKSSNHYQFDSITNMQAALGISQLKRYSQFIKKRNYIFGKFYSTTKKNSLNLITDINSNMKFRFVIKTKISFKNLEKKFLKNKIIIRKGVDNLLHRILNLDDKNYKNSVELFNSALSVPFYPALTTQEIKRIKNLLKEIKNED